MLYSNEYITCWVRQCISSTAPAPTSPSSAHRIDRKFCRTRSLSASIRLVAFFLSGERHWNGFTVFFLYDSHISFDFFQRPVYCSTLDFWFMFLSFSDRSLRNGRCRNCWRAEHLFCSIFSLSRSNVCDPASTTHCICRIGQGYLKNISRFSFVRMLCVWVSSMDARLQSYRLLWCWWFDAIEHCGCVLTTIPSSGRNRHRRRRRGTKKK